MSTEIRKSQFISWSLYALRLVCLCPSHGHPQPTTWASTEQVLGNKCPYTGQRMPKLRDLFWAIQPVLGNTITINLMILFKRDFVKKKIQSWYFYETLMRLFCIITEKSHSFYLIVYQAFKPIFSIKKRDFETFSTKKIITYGFAPNKLVSCPTHEQKGLTSRPALL